MKSFDLDIYVLFFFQNAKKEEFSRKAYKLLAGLHEVWLFVYFSF